MRRRFCRGVGLTNIGHRKLSSVLSARSPVAKWRSRSVAKSAYCLFWSATGRQDLPFLALVPFPARPNRKSRSSICLPSETKRKRLLRALPKFMFLTLESDVLESAHRLSLGCLCFKRKLPEVLTFAEWKAPPLAPFLSSENNLLFTREWTHFHICDCALALSVVLKERLKTSQNWAIWK